MASGLRGPGRNLVEEALRQHERGDSGCYEPMHRALGEINRTLKQRDEAVALLGEILATLRIPANQEHPIKALAEKGILANWLERCEKVSGKP